MIPAHEGLEAQEVSVRTYLGLKANIQLIPAQGMMDFRLQGPILFHVFANGVREHLTAISATCLCFVHGFVSGFLQCREIRAMLRRKTDSDACAQQQLVAIDFKGFLQTTKNILGNFSGRNFIGSIDKHHEFIAAHTSNGIGMPNIPGEAFTHLYQQLVPNCVTERIVDLPEPVKVHKQDSLLHSIHIRRRPGAGKSFAEQAAVRKSGQDIVARPKS
jgi:hypothetical protein